MDRPDTCRNKRGNDRIRLAFPAFETSGNPFFSAGSQALDQSLLCGRRNASLDTNHSLTVTVVCPAGSFPAFFENSLTNNPSFTYPLRYDALPEQILDARSLLPCDTLQLVS